VDIAARNYAQFHQLLDMWIPYHREIGNTESDTAIVKYARQRVDIQGNREDMHFELSFADNTMIGFCFYAVDLGGIRNILPPNLGYIMEFYVSPQYRRQGYGSEMYRHVETTFSKHGVESIYLTPDETSGEPFWVSLGFVNSGKVDPDNHMPIYIKKIGQ
jgi:ribosomal protein S18 acetylase RimI-like enzyme